MSLAVLAVLALVALLLVLGAIYWFTPAPKKRFADLPPASPWIAEPRSQVHIVPNDVPLTKPRDVYDQTLDW